MVPPVFWQKLAYFYLSGTETTSSSYLYTYQWNDLTNKFDLVCEKTLSSEDTMHSQYHKYSLINVGDDGVILGRYDGNFQLYKCNPDDGTWTTDTTVTIDNPDGALTHWDKDTDDAQTRLTSYTTLDTAVLILTQAREDPDTYDSATFPPIYGLSRDDYIH